MMMMLLFTHSRGKHVGTNRNVRYTKMATKIGAPKGAKKKKKVVRHTTLTFDMTKCEKLQDGELREHVLQKGALQYFYQFHILKNAVELLYMSFTLYFDCVQTYYEVTRGRKLEMSTPFVPVILKIVKEEGKPFFTFWLVDVEKVYMPLNLDNHWVAMEKNLKASRITMGKCRIFTLKVIDFLFANIPLDLIKPQNVPAFRLRMVVNMLHEVHNV
ncbi:hypothetical protein D8674_000236 [Pyrus ussuriensis x Pyrus communis]|uniref:Ubiquitin-like protease family profile domain-containing protein n=1 Tax=Pyrus ussuriensis x Pyrus communis TaxID=2448454 RepID=A0A5N5F2S3_9ROSA|nr:hypothetical protein D8674_000236 [Pyrus ussuriensis x Pyrus communis]